MTLMEEAGGQDVEMGKFYRLCLLFWTLQHITLSNSGECECNTSQSSKGYILLLHGASE